MLDARYLQRHSPNHMSHYFGGRLALDNPIGSCTALFTKRFNFFIYLYLFILCCIINNDNFINRHFKMHKKSNNVTEYNCITKNQKNSNLWYFVYTSLMLDDVHQNIGPIVGKFKETRTLISIATS